MLGTVSSKTKRLCGVFCGGLRWFQWVVVDGGTTTSNLIIDGGLLVKPFPNALKNDVWEVAGLTNGAAASAMLIVDSGNREDTPAKVDECDEILKVGGEVVVDSVGS